MLTVSKGSFTRDNAFLRWLMNFILQIFFEFLKSKDNEITDINEEYISLFWVLPTDLDFNDTRESIDFTLFCLSTYEITWLIRNI